MGLDRFEPAEFGLSFTHFFLGGDHLVAERLQLGLMLGERTAFLMKLTVKCINGTGGGKLDILLAGFGIDATLDYSVADVRLVVGG